MTNAFTSDVVPRGTASPRGSLEAQFSLPRPRSRSRLLLPRSWPRSRLSCLDLATASRHLSQRSQFCMTVAWFLPARRYASSGLSRPTCLSVRLSDRPSLRPSITRRHCQNEES